MKISVLTPSYNSVKYIKRAIESVLIQDYANWEHIVMDGGSTDGTTEILKAYPHLIWVSEPDQGQSEAMNKAFNRSVGDVIIYLNVDDELEHGAMNHVIEALKSDSKCDMVVGNLRVNHLGKITFQKPSIKLIQILNYWPCRFPLNPVSYAYKRELQAKVGPFQIDNHYAMDYWFLLWAYLFGRIKKVEFLLGTYHIDGFNKSVDADRAKEHLKQVRNGFLLKNIYRPFAVYFGMLLIYRFLRKSAFGRN